MTEEIKNYSSIWRIWINHVIDFGEKNTADISFGLQMK